MSGMTPWERPRETYMGSMFIFCAMPMAAMASA